MSPRGPNGRDDEAPAGSSGEATEGGPPPDDAAARGRAPDGAGSESGLVAVEVVQDDVDALRRERDELKDALLRRRAEFENYKKRVERDRQAAALDAAAEIFRRLVDTVDNLERALAADANEGSLRAGVELTLRDLRATLEAQGVAVVDPVGRRFDPLLHQALVHEQVPGCADGTVAEVFRKGYTFKDRLLRPALVKVASAGSDAGGETGDAGGGEDVS
jgi:molecular chaperone GrpE